ncbi:MAG: septum formation inhibitor Maf [Clostridia bacterium]|nr:septum formation inhibitor Maf [Clostridia bacterium]
MAKIILASGSPRRKEIFDSLGFDYKVVVPSIDESSVQGETPSELVARLSAEKAADAVAKIGGKLPVVASDTVVQYGDRILGKPKNPKEAFDMLRLLSGCGHTVHTGLTVAFAGDVLTETVSTHVYFRELSDREILFYVESGEPMDKAGSYGIQSLASVFVKRIDGDYFAVVGLPVCRMTEMLSSFGINTEDLRRD